MNQHGGYIRGGGILGAPSDPTYREQAQQILRQADVRPASPVESELSRLDGEVARLEGLMHSLADRLKPVTIGSAAGQACSNAPYEGCQIGARINGAATNVRDIADKLDSLLSALQV